MRKSCLYSMERLQRHTMSMPTHRTSIHGVSFALSQPYLSTLLYGLDMNIIGVQEPVTIT